MAKIGQKGLAGIVAALILLFTASFMPGDTSEPSEPIKSLNFQAAEVRSVIRFLADYGKVNVVVAPAVKGNVTISLSDVTWQQAMEIIGRTYDLAVVYEEAGYIRILPAEDYRKEVTEIKKYEKEQVELVGLETRIIRISNSTAATVVEAVKSLLSSRGIVSSDSRTNSIVLQEIPDNIEKVSEYIKQLDQPPRQIRISAQLLEVSSGSLKEMGIDWTLLGSTGIDMDDPFTGTTEPRNRHSTQQNLNLITPPAPLDINVTTLQSGWDLTAHLSALVDEGNGKIIAHPEITTIDNTEATIQMGQKVPIKQFDEAGNTITKFEEVGTLLKVTPHITSENRILMHLVPERSTFEFDPNGVIINTNNAETNIVVENGQTAVIGGLTTQDEVESRTGIPILMDIPVIGNIFSYTNKRVENRDLVIFVTPTIVDDYAAVDKENP